MTVELTYFVSYAHADQAPTGRLLDLLAPRLAIARGYRFRHWIDDRIAVGERWTDAIGAVLAGCDFGLLLLSPSFLASGFIRREELPTFIERISNPGGGAGSEAETRIRKPLVPVMLKPIPLDGSADLAGLDQLQLFRDRERRAFTETRGHTADAFADQLVAAMLTKLRRIWPQDTP
ncbi:toll/interleukin-1 receptor domain-containing protein [Candidatus Thiodictyon syntrophicum]|uniref:toll/interleukin-1 receptor domain-containing protein n=1 Tax=Candidatus Thiodictyon syntrophicum TaxID=1166950 RepID=UPI0012FD6644|nr:toll/interleukin-1 receptor domain-containing protein [Candidatus Thiodictyon syntrophicum]